MTSLGYYEFATRWQMDATVDEVAAILGDATALTRWWPSVYLGVWEHVPGDSRGVGKVVELWTKGALPYTLRWTLTVLESRYPYGFSIQASGDLEGHGEWTLSPNRNDGQSRNEPGCLVEYLWKVRANKPLLRYLSPILRPFFSANHDWAMAKGYESLRLEILRQRSQHLPESGRHKIAAPPRATFRWMLGTARSVGVTLPNDSSFG